MKIYNSKPLKDLQEEFNKRFPYLKIEFFKTPHEEGLRSQEEDRLDPNLSIGAVREKSNVGFMSMDGKMQVGFFEKTFEDSFGLNVQVYRKSHGKWLQTWVSDVWTLEEQNNRGRILGDIDDALAS